MPESSLYKSWPLSDEAFVKANDKLVKHYEVTTERVIFLALNAIEDQLDDYVKVLSIGSGDGQLEEKIIEAMMIKRTDKKVTQIDAYEPNEKMFEHLKHRVEKKRIWGHTGVKFNLTNEAVTGETKFPQSGYNIITMSHMYYYLHDKEDRKKIFKNVQEALVPGGRIFIINADDKSKEGKPSELVKMTSACLALLEPAENHEHVNRYTQSDQAISATQIYKENKPLMKSDVTCVKEDLEAVLNYGNIAQDHERFKGITAILLSCDLDRMSRDANEAIKKVVRRNSKIDANGDTKLYYPDSIIIYTKAD